MNNPNLAIEPVSRTATEGCIHELRDIAGFEDWVSEKAPASFFHPRHFVTAMPDFSA